MQGTKRPADALDSDSETDDYDYTHEDNVSDSSEPQIISRHRHRLYTDSRRLAITEPKSTEPKHEFQLFKAILRHPNLFFEFTMRLPPQVLDDLYAIDKEFHWRFNKYHLATTRAYVKYHAPVACEIFSYSLYQKLCISDPTLKPMDGRTHLARDVPSIRWTKMVIQRDAVVKEILTLLAMEGHRVPRATAKVVMKYWTLMEITSQATRLAFVRSRDFWTNSDLFLFHLFLVKLDMRFSHPVTGKGICALAKLLLTQKSLVTLRDALSGKLVLDYDSAAEMVIRTYPQEDLDLDTHPWMDDWTESGVDEWEWGILSKEGWDDVGGGLDAGVDLLRQEAIRRRLHLQRFTLDFALYGYVDEGTGKNIPVPRKWRNDKEVVMPKKGWPLNEEKAAMIKKWDTRFGVVTEVKKEGAVAETGKVESS